MNTETQTGQKTRANKHSLVGEGLELLDNNADGVGSESLFLQAEIDDLCGKSARGEGRLFKVSCNRITR